jgi:SAM-dependent methyltransferase
VDHDQPPTEWRDIEAASVFDVYDDLLVPLCFQAHADDLAARLRGLRDAAVLVIACGTGVDTRALADALPASVTITATDLVPGMVERAQRRGTSRPVDWDVADATGLPYEDESFDVVVCQFGAMFFPDKAAAFRESARVLRPDGRFEVSVWDRLDANDFASAVAAAMRETFPDDPPAFLDRMPYSYHDADRLSDDLAGAGFAVPAGIEQVGHTALAGSSDLVAGAFCGGTPLRDQLRAGGPDRLPAALAAASSVVAERFGAAEPSGTTSALLATARKA